MESVVAPGLKSGKAGPFAQNAHSNCPILVIVTHRAAKSVYPENPFACMILARAPLSILTQNPGRRGYV